MIRVSIWSLWLICVLYMPSITHTTPRLASPYNLSIVVNSTSEPVYVFESLPIENKFLSTATGAYGAIYVSGITVSIQVPPDQLDDAFCVYISMTTYSFQTLNSVGAKWVAEPSDFPHKAGIVFDTNIYRENFTEYAENFIEFV
eukprot:PhF_6_TR1825/c0_g1_i1/m.2950